jgi:hypothetical protein
VAPDPEQRSELLGETVLVERADLELPQQRKRPLVRAEELLDAIGLEPFRAAECAERLPDVRGEDAAEVDEQRSHVRGAGSCVIWCAASASAGTPSSNSLR